MKRRLPDHALNGGLCPGCGGLLSWHDCPRWNAVPLTEQLSVPQWAFEALCRSLVSRVAAPDRAPDKPRSPNNAPPTTKGPSLMSTTPTERGTTTGSNPAGVASPNHDKDAASSDRTELRSVPSAEDRRDDAVAADPKCDGCGLPIPPTQAESCVDCRIDGRGILSVHSFGKCKDQHEAKRGCARHQLQHEYSALTETKPEVPSVPEVRRCLARVVLVGGHRTEEESEPCGAVIGTGLHCDVCHATRCYHHCHGIDHFGGGRVVTRGGAGATTWKIVEIAAGRFQGQVYRADNGVVGILHTCGSESVNQVMREMERLMGDELVRQGFAAGEIEKPLTITSAASEAVRAGRGTREQRERVLAEVIEWLGSSEAAWQELIPEVPSASAFDAIEKAKALHDKLTVELFARIGGAL